MLGLGSATEGILGADLLHLFSTSTFVGVGGKGSSFRNVFIAFVPFLSVLFLNFLIEVCFFVFLNIYRLPL